MLPQLIKYIRDHAKSWPVKLKADDLLMPLFRFNKEANGIVQSEQIGTIVFWFTEEKRNPCLVSKILDNSLSVEYIKTHVKRQQEINKKIGRAVFSNIYDVAEICNHPVIFQEAINTPTYEMELQKAIHGPSGNLSLLKQVIERHFKEISFLFNHLKKFNASKQILHWGNWSYSVGEDFRNNYGLKLGFLSDNCLDRMKEEINSMSLQRNYVLVDHHCANYFAGPRIVDQIDRLLPKRMSNEPGIIDVFRFIIAYFRASPLNAVYKDWLGAMACSIMDKDGLIITGSPVRRLLHDLGLNTDEHRKIWALVMISFFLRAIDELTFHQQNIFIISRLRTEFEQLTKRLIEIQDQIENDKGCDFSFVLRSQENFIPPCKLISSDSISQLPCLIEEGYKGFNIVLFKGKYFGVSQDLGFIDFTKIDESLIEEYKKQSRWVIANSLPEAKCLVEEVLSKDLQKEGGEARREIETLSKDVSDRDENIRRLMADLEGRIRDLNSVHRELEERGKKIEALNEKMVEQNKRIEGLEKELAEQGLKINSLKEEVSDKETKINILRGVNVSFSAVPVLLDSYEGYNLVQFKDRICGILQALGDLDLLKEGESLVEYEEDGRCVVGDSVSEVKHLIGRILCRDLGKGVLERDKKIEALLKDVSNNKEENAKRLLAEIKEKNRNLDLMQRELEEGDKRIGVLQKGISEKDENIKGLNIELEIRDKKMEALHKEIGERDKSIGALSKEVEYRDKSLFKKDEDIRRLNAECTEMRNRAEGLQGEIREMNRSIEILNEEISNRGTRIEILQKDVVDRDFRIDGLQKEVLQKGNNIGKLNIEAKECNKKIETLEVDILQKNRNIETLKQDISNRDENIVKLSNDIEAHNIKINTLQEHLLEKDKNIEALKKDISNRDEEINKLNNESTVMGSYIKELQEEIVNIKSKWWFKYFNRKG